MMAGMTKGKFGFHRGGGEHEPGPAAYVQIPCRGVRDAAFPPSSISQKSRRIDVNGASPDAIVDQIKRCPSGALTRLEPLKQ